MTRVGFTINRIDYEQEAEAAFQYLYFIESGLANRFDDFYIIADSIPPEHPLKDKFITKIDDPRLDDIGLLISSLQGQRYGPGSVVISRNRAKRVFYTHCQTHVIATSAHLQPEPFNWIHSNGWQFLEPNLSLTKSYHFMNYASRRFHIPVYTTGDLLVSKYRREGRGSANLSPGKPMVLLKLPTDQANLHAWKRIRSFVNSVGRHNDVSVMASPHYIRDGKDFYALQRHWLNEHGVSVIPNDIDTYIRALRGHDPWSNYFTTNRPHITSGNLYAQADVCICTTSEIIPQAAACGCPIICLGLDNQGGIIDEDQDFNYGPEYYNNWLKSLSSLCYGADTINDVWMRIYKLIEGHDDIKHTRDYHLSTIYPRVDAVDSMLYMIERYLYEKR